jgi:hypothetical protein
MRKVRFFSWLGIACLVLGCFLLFVAFTSNASMDAVFYYSWQVILLGSVLAIFGAASWIFSPVFFRWRDGHLSFYRKGASAGWRGGRVWQCGVCKETFPNEGSWLHHVNGHVVDVQSSPAP